MLQPLSLLHFNIFHDQYKHKHQTCRIYVHKVYMTLFTMGEETQMGHTLFLQRANPQDESAIRSALAPTTDAVQSKHVA